MNIRCPNCQLMRINGVVCHETGCPDRKLNVFNGMYLHECRECGCEVESIWRDAYECCNNNENQE